MTSLATVMAYQQLEPIIATLGAEDPEALRRDLACLLAYHSCRSGSFAQAYAWSDLAAQLGFDAHALPIGFIMRHPIRSFGLWRARRKAEK